MFHDGTYVPDTEWNQYYFDNCLWEEGYGIAFASPDNSHNRESDALWAYAFRHSTFQDDLNTTYVIMLDGTVRCYYSRYALRYVSYVAEKPYLDGKRDLHALKYDWNEYLTTVAASKK